MSSKNDASRVVRVSSKGQATIPQPLREKFGIDAPGRVRFRENEQGEIVVEPVPHPRDLRGVLDAGDRDVWAELDELTAAEREREAADLDDLVDDE